jgi:hypothetical protein
VRRSLPREEAGAGEGGIKRCRRSSQGGRNSSVMVTTAHHSPLVRLRMVAPWAFRSAIVARSALNRQGSEFGSHWTKKEPCRQMSIDCRQKLENGIRPLPDNGVAAEESARPFRGEDDDDRSDRDGAR